MNALYTALTCFLTLLTTTVWAQPRLDSMVVDEFNGKLKLLGSFGQMVGTVGCDSVPLSIVEWTDSAIVVMLPDTGKGYAGTVTVEANGKVTGILTSVEGSMATLHTERHSRQFQYGQTISFRVRVDLRAHLLAHPTEPLAIAAPPTTTLWEWYSRGSQWDQNYGYETNWNVNQTEHAVDPSLAYTHGFVGTAMIDCLDQTLYMSATKIKGYTTTISYRDTGGYHYTSVPYEVGDQFFAIALDSSFSVKPVEQETTYYAGAYSDQTTVEGSIHFAPVKAIAISQPPLVVGPGNGDTRLGTASVELFFVPAKYVDSCRIQLSEDSLFRSGSLDTMLHEDSLLLSPLKILTTYYWRVAGVNSEGQSRWSDVWHFTTGTNADVALTTSTNNGFSVVPNPAGAMVTISTTAGSSIESARVYDLLGRDVLHTRGGSTAELHLDVSSLSDGVYVLDLNNGVRTLLRVDHSTR